VLSVCIYSHRAGGGGGGEGSEPVRRLKGR
jgi:hypothetical protein